MLSFPEKIAFILITLISLVLTYKSFTRMIKIINRGEGKLPFDNLKKRIYRGLIVLISQKSVLTDRIVVSFIHTLVAWAFILYFLVNIGDVLSGFISNYHFLGTGISGNLYRLFVDIFSVLAIIAIVWLLFRRFIVDTPKLKIRENVKMHPKARDGMIRDSLIVGLFIFFHVGFRFLGESFYLANSVLDKWQPLNSFVASLWTHLSPQVLNTFFHIAWWLAIGLILAFLPYFPLSKHAHLFMGPFNYMVAPNRTAPGTLERLDFEAEGIEQFGVARIEQLEKSQLVDTYACIMCNRCQDVCPAYVTGKELSPSALEINKRYYLNHGGNILIKGKNSEQNLIEYAITESALWACTSCAACVEICPVGNEPMYDILNIRRNQVLMEAKFPNQLQNAFNGMERNGNPWNMNKDRLEWIKEDPSLKVKTIEENPDFDILYWVGCAGAFDQRGQKIARAFAKILNRAGINFAVLGNKENCTGDSARRTGNEYLFTMIAEANVENLKAVKVKRIVTTCPHCLHTLKNEYPQYGGHFEVLHHTQLIKEIVGSGKLNFNNNTPHKLTFHDPCYLGRHNQVFDEPRFLITTTGNSLLEMSRNRNRSFCCGAGGGNMWKEEEAGEEAIRRERFKEAVHSGAEKLVTGCPFCMTMLRDAGNELDSKLPVEDIAEIIAENI